jgi:hypothetical protein
VAVKKAKAVHEVTLRFPSAFHKDYFLGQLSDGWGENLVYLTWRGDMKTAKVVGVRNFGDYWEHALKMRRKYGWMRKDSKKDV